MLFRISRGNAVVRFIAEDEEIADPESRQKIQKVVFHIMYLGVQQQRRIEKMCDQFKAARYEIPESDAQFDREISRLERQIIEKEEVLKQTTRQVKESLNRVALGPNGHSPLRTWQESLRVEKLVCDALKMCSMPNGSSVVTCEGWIPTEHITDLYRTCEHVGNGGDQRAVVQLLPKEGGPTYFKLNKFTSTFQGIVNTYGVPRYQEVNPGLFTCVTFPFLFGVMYGDMGHAFGLFCFGLWLCYKEEEFEKLKKRRQLSEIFGMLYGGRYLLILMGFFGFYAGLIYNDLVSVPLDLFGSKYHYVGNATNATWTGEVYSFGIDPAWYNTKNELLFFNSLKMKLAVTLGVIHMCFGITLGVFNHLHFKKPLSIYFEFIPQLTFMLCTFGYMIFLIIYKMCVDWTMVDHPAPNLIQTMIEMFLSPGSVAKDKQLYDGQGGVQAILVLAAVVSIPVMLFGKPCMERRQARQRHAAKHVQHHSDDGADGAEIEADGEDAHDHESEFSEHMIHQSIHTIEFVLGAVSNTASYLRLWALSLAHAELANVFWDKLIRQYGLENGSPLFVFIMFGAWAGASFAVLMCMDSLECFLHALRLHWVEFQNKFYNADGYQFMPFTYEPAEEA